MTISAFPTLQAALDAARAGQLEDLLAKVRLGTMLTPLKRTFSGLTAAPSFDLTQIDGTGETTGLQNPAFNPKRLAALVIGTLRVTAGAAAAGVRTVGDSGATVSATIAKLSDDGKTITFEANVTGFVVTYIPRSFSDMTAFGVVR